MWGEMQDVARVWRKRRWLGFGFPVGMGSETMITVQPEALLATAAATTPIASLYEVLRAHGVWFPIVPLVRNQTLRDLVRCNAGGRYRLKHGPIANYLRGAVLSFPSPPSWSLPLEIGGKTLKRATGYRLPQALVGQPLPGPLHQMTFRVVPFPQARRGLLWVCPDMGTADRFATWILRNTFPSALALAAVFPQGEGSMATPLLLVGLEGPAPVVQRKTDELVVLARQAAVTFVAADGYDEPENAPGEFGWACWRVWEEVAEQWSTETPSPSPSHQDVTLDMTWPRSRLHEVVRRVHRFAVRYGLSLTLWGDLGVGTLHMRLASDAHLPEEIHQAGRLLFTLAQQWGGRWSTERGTTPIIPSPAHHSLFPTVHSPNVREGDQEPLGVLSPSSRSSLLTALRRIVGHSAVLSERDELLCYGMDASIAQSNQEPLAVVFPKTTDEVRRLVRLAASNRIPLIPRGSGSGLAGGVVPSAEAIIVSFSRMQRMSLDPVGQRAVVQAGVITADLQRAAEGYGLCYPPDPSSQRVSTIGGNVACNAGGSHGLKYGVTADYVVSLTAVLADGTVVVVGDEGTGQTPDAGLMHLLIGSEGTLALITEATVRLIPRPSARRTMLVCFDTMAQAGATVQAIIAAGLIPASLELMDHTTINMVETFAPQGLPREAGAMLLVQVDGDLETVDWELQHLSELAQSRGGWGLRWARSAEEEHRIWKARRAIGPALARMAPNKLGEDICVPIPRIVEAVERIQTIAKHHHLTIPIFGHAGDGNLHPNILFDAKKPGEMERVWRVAGEIFQVALDLGGTLSGEHGIGLLKRPFLTAALGETVLTWQRAIKTAYDPLEILNPGKLLPPFLRPS